MESNVKRMKLVYKASMLFKSKFYLLSVCVRAHIYSYSISEHTIFHKVIMEEVPWYPFKIRFLNLQNQNVQSRVLGPILNIL